MSDEEPFLSMDFMLTHFAPRRLSSSLRDDFTARGSYYSEHRLDALAFIIFAGMIFPRANGRLDGRVVALMIRMREDERSLTPMILAETFRGLPLCTLIRSPSLALVLRSFSSGCTAIPWRRERYTPSGSSWSPLSGYTVVLLVARGLNMLRPG